MEGVLRHFEAGPCCTYSLIRWIEITHYFSNVIVPMFRMRLATFLLQLIFGPVMLEGLTSP